MIGVDLQSPGVGLGGVRSLALSVENASYLHLRVGAQPLIVGRARKRLALREGGFQLGQRLLVVASEAQRLPQLDARFRSFRRQRRRLAEELLRGVKVDLVEANRAQRQIHLRNHVAGLQRSAQSLFSFAGFVHVKQRQRDVIVRGVHRRIRLQRAAVEFDRLLRLTEFPVDLAQQRKDVRDSRLCRQRLLQFGPGLVEASQVDVRFCQVKARPIERGLQVEGLLEFRFGLGEERKGTTSQVRLAKQEVRGGRAWLQCQRAFEFLYCRLDLALLQMSRAALKVGTRGVLRGKQQHQEEPHTQIVAGSRRGSIMPLMLVARPAQTMDLFSRRGFLGAALALPVSVRAQSADLLQLSDVEVEEFLRTAKIVKIRGLGMGITLSQRATLSDGKIQCDAHIQTIDESKMQFQGQLGTEMNFRDSWKFNVAGYKLDRLLGLRMTPVSVERKVQGRSGAVTFWMTGCMMEIERHKKKIEPPDSEDWNKQMYIVRVFDQLIFNTDRNLQNLLISKDWKLWMIDHTRAFRLHKDIREPKNLVRCERKLLARMKTLTMEELQQAMTGYLTKPEMEGLLGRRDKIVKLFEEKVAKQGEADVLYDYART